MGYRARLWVWSVFVWVVCGFGWAAGCGQEPAGPAASSGSVVVRPLLPADDPSEAVARVNGQPISRQRLEAAHQRAAPGTSKAQTLRALIDLELLTQEAARLGLDQLPSALDFKHTAAIQRLLEDTIERPISTETLPPELPAQAYEGFSLDIFEPELVSASHLLIELPEAAQTPERVAQARAFAQTLRDQILARSALSLPTAADLDAVAAFANLSGWTVRAEHGFSFPARPIAPMPGAQPRFPAVVQPFADAAFALTPQAPLSEPVVTTFGVHLILLIDRRPDLRPAFEAARDDIAQKLITAQRRITTQQLLKRLSDQTPIRLDEEPLNALAKRLFGTSAN